MEPALPQRSRRAGAPPLRGSGHGHRHRHLSSDARGGRRDLGVLKENHVNVIVHGHEPELPDMMYAWPPRSRRCSPRPRRRAPRASNWSGMCCSANEILMRHGIPIRRQLHAVRLGDHHRGGGRHDGGRAVHPGRPWPTIAKCYHTKFITTNYRCHIDGAEHIEFEEQPHARQAGEELMSHRHRQLPQPRRRVQIPEGKTEHRGRRVQPRGDQLHAGRLVPGLLHPAQREHHQRPHPRRGRRGGLQQPAAPSTTGCTSSWSRS